MDWRGASYEERLEFMGKVDEILKRIDLKIIDATADKPLSTTLKVKSFNPTELARNSKESH